MYFNKLQSKFLDFCLFTTQLSIYDSADKESKIEQFEWGNGVTAADNIGDRKFGLLSLSLYATFNIFVANSVAVFCKMLRFANI